MLQYDDSQWAYLSQPPSSTADFRAQPEHFQVEEDLGFEPSGSGEHVFLWIEKRGHNTQFVAKQLAKFANTQPRNVSYSGLKDRHAVTKQWFSVPVPIKTELNWCEFDMPDVTILKAIRHGKKLRTGTHKFNHFSIGLTNITEQAQMLAAIEKIKQTGVPNYYGPQRFGHNGNNLVKAQQMLLEAGTKRRGKQSGLYLSAARSFLFNHLLSERIKADYFDHPLSGDSYLLCGSQSFFVSDVDESILHRLQTRDIDLALPLFSSVDQPVTQGAALTFEQQVLADFDELTQGLSKERLSSSCRAMRLMPQSLSVRVEGESVWLSFTLPKGAFATSVLRELAIIRDISEAIA